MRDAITSPKVGSRVWTIRGLNQAGSAKAPATAVPPHTGGVIISSEKPWYAPTVGGDLLVLRWDTEQVTEHPATDLGEIICLGPFQNLTDFEEALKNAESAEVVLGLHDEFREFKAILRLQGQELLVHLGRGQEQLWNYIWPVLISGKVNVRKTVRNLP